MPTPFMRASGLLPLMATALSAAAQPTNEPEHALPAVTVTVNKQSQALAKGHPRVRRHENSVTAPGKRRQDGRLSQVRVPQ